MSLGGVSAYQYGKLAPMTPPVPSNKTVAHDLQDLVDEAQPFLERLQHPASVENELRTVGHLRNTTMMMVETYVDTLLNLVAALVDDQETFLREREQTSTP